MLEQFLGSLLDMLEEIKASVLMHPGGGAHYETLSSFAPAYAGATHCKVPKVREFSYTDVKSPVSLPLSLSILLLGALLGAASHTNFAYHGQ